MSIRIRVVLMVVAIHSLGMALRAQQGEAERGEISVYTGGLSGLETSAVVGGGLGYAFSRYGMYMLDTSFSPLGTTTLRTHRDAVITQSRLYNFNFGVQVRVPVKQRFEPYGIIGGGVLYSSFHYVQRDPLGGETLIAGRETNFGFQTGGGARIYMGEQWGFRPEVRVVLSHRNYTTFTFGIFYQFRAEDGF